MSFQWEAGYLRLTELAHTRTSAPVAGFTPLKQLPKPIPTSPAMTVSPEPLPQFTALVEINCQDCGGTGFDPGSVNPREPEDCVTCHGSGREIILRNYLAEAFRIAADPQTKLELERAHLVALTSYARQTVSALLSLQEVA
jgi:hypothetical protein